MPEDSSNQMGRTVGARLRAARLAKKYTQNQLARPDFSVSYISAIERGQIQPSLRALEILALRLELPTTDLLPLPGQLVSEMSPGGSAAIQGEERELLLLEAQIAIHQGRPEQAIELLRLLSTQKGEQRQRSVICYILGWAYLAGGHLQESEQWLAQAARETTGSLYPRVLSLQSAVYTDMHNTEQAAQLRQVSEAFLEQPSASIDNVFFRARLYASLGQHYSYLEQFARAREMFRQALLTFEVEHTAQPHLAACWHLARVYQEHEEHQLAALYNQRGLLLASQDRLLILRSEIQYTLGHALLKIRPDEAYIFFLDALQEAVGRNDFLSQAGASAHLANWFIAHYEFAKAEQYAREAQKLADPFADTLIAADVQFLLGELAYHREDYASGDRSFEAGLAMLERLRKKEELTERLARYAGLLEERGLIDRAILYWKQAYENRQQNWTSSH